MLKFIVLAILGLLILSISEFIRKRVGLANEYSRKNYHAVHAVLIGFAPFLVSYQIIIGFEILLFVEMLLVRKYKLMPWLYDVGRISWGDLFGVCGVIFISVLNPDPWVFLVAMFHLGLADSAAALIGKKYGKTTSYKVFGNVKSLVGSMAFLLTSVVITIAALALTPLQIQSLYVLLILPPLVTLSENISIFGSDNFVIPAVVVLVLQAL